MAHGSTRKCWWTSNRKDIDHSLTCNGWGARRSRDARKEYRRSFDVGEFLVLGSWRRLMSHLGMGNVRSASSLPSRFRSGEGALRLSGKSVRD